MAWLRRIFGSKSISPEAREAIKNTILAQGHPEALFSSAYDENTPARLVRECYILQEGGWTRISRAEAMEKFSRGLRKQADTNDAIEGLDNPGGMIVVSTNISHGDGGWWEKLKAKVQSLLWDWVESQRLKSVDQAISKSMTDAEGNVRPVGFSVGNLFHGRYVDPQGNVFDENSMAVDIAGVDTDTLNNIATALREEFQQQAVMVQNRNTNSAYFVRRKE